MKMKTLLFVLLLFGCNQAHTSDKGQNQIPLPKDTIKSETKDSITSPGPNSIVRTIIQDRKGNIWMASWEGIFRYDGKSFTNMTEKVSSARFFSVLEDRKGNFWFGTIGEGVYYYDGTSFKHFTIREGLLNNEVTSIYEDTKGNIWFGVSGGVSCYDPSAYIDSAQHKSLRAGGKLFRNYIIDGDAINEDRSGETFPERQPNGVNIIKEDKTGNLWIGSTNELFIYDGKTFATLTNNDGKTFKNVWSITEDRKGNIWFGADDGLWRYDPSAHFVSAQHESLGAGGNTFTKLSEKGAISILEDKNGDIWTTSVVGRSCELLRYDGMSLSNPNPTVTNVSNGEFNLYFGILEAFDGSIWVGSGSGVYLYDGKTFTAFKRKEGDN